MAKRRDNRHWFRALLVEVLGVVLLIWICSQGWTGTTSPKTNPGSTRSPSAPTAVEPNLTQPAVPRRAAESDWVRSWQPPSRQERIAYTETRLEEAAGAIRSALSRR